MVLQSLPENSGWRLFKVEGQLDFASGPAIQTAIAHVGSDDGRNVLIDLESVASADEPGVNALATAIRQLLRDHPVARVAVVVRSRWLWDALSRSGLPARVEIHRRGADAIRAILGRRTTAAA